MKQLLYIPEGRYINFRSMNRAGSFGEVFSEAVPEDTEMILSQTVYGDFSVGFYSRNTLPTKTLAREMFEVVEE